MKIPLSWVSLYSDISPLFSKYEPKALAHEYSIHTAEIDGIETSYFDKVVVGKVISCEKHPDSKKLSIVEVDVGINGKTTILTGAPNIIDAKYVPVALVGAVLPGDFTIGERMMAGMMSRGMICSDDELGLTSEERDGIMILETYWTEEILEKMLGKSFFDLEITLPGLQGETYATPIRDTVFEIDNKFITNRPDLFSVAGNAREFHAIFQTDFRPYASNITLPREKKLKTEIQTDRVLSYHLLAMNDIEIGDMPWGMKLMMHRANLTSKMDIVDITNMVMTEIGQPMHAFDSDKVEGHIIVRMAKKGEKLLALNGNEYQLTEEDIVIADTKKILAIAGVIGGMESAVSRETKNILWESGCFDPVSVRFTTQRLGVRTDASTRYEKSLDPLLAVSGLSRAIEYMDFLSKKYTFTGLSEHIDPSKLKHPIIDVTKEFIDRKIGAEIPEVALEGILTRLGFSFQKTQSANNGNQETLYTLTVPSWRATKDINIKEDIAEEVGRVYGYDNVEEKSLDANFRIGKRNAEISLRDTTNNYFSSKGWYEVYHYSFSNESLDKKIGYHSMDSAIHIENAFNEEYTHMRRSLFPRLLESTMINEKHKSTFGFFELGNVYIKTENEEVQTDRRTPFTEKKQLAGVYAGGSLAALKETIEGYLLESIGYVPPIHHSNSLTGLFHPGVSGSYVLEGEEIVRFGKVHPGVTHSFELSGEIFAFEVEYTRILELSTDKEVIFHTIQKFPTIARELNFIFDLKTEIGGILSHIDSLHPWIDDVRIVSEYYDEDKIGVGKKSVTFGFILANPESTITDTEALEIQNMIIARMEEDGYILRS